MPDTSNVSTGTRLREMEVELVRLLVEVLIGHLVLQLGAAVQAFKWVVDERGAGEGALGQG